MNLAFACALSASAAKASSSLTATVSHAVSVSSVVLASLTASLPASLAASLARGVFASLPTSLAASLAMPAKPAEATRARRSGQAEARKLRGHGWRRSRARCSSSARAGLASVSAWPQRDACHANGGTHAQNKAAAWLSRARARQASGPTLRSGPERGREPAAGRVAASTSRDRVPCPACVQCRL